MLAQARALALAGRDAEAKLIYVEVLRADPGHCSALVELGVLAQASGHASAARSVFSRAVECHPGNALARVGLANQLREDGALQEARVHYVAALAREPEMAAAHRGLAWVFEAMGDDIAAAVHRERGFAGHAVVHRRYRGVGAGIPVLLLVSSRGGNIPVQSWINEREFAVTAIYADFYDAPQALPPHVLVVNAIGDADLCSAALDGAEAILALTTEPVINLPGRVRETTREGNSRRLAGIPGVIAPVVRTWRRAELLAAEGEEYPLLLRAPGFHTGQHFVRVASPDALPGAVHSLPGADILALQYLDARGADGMARKYRVMFVDGVAYPLHLAISADWKVHYFSAAMAGDAGYRAEEKHFLEDMPGVLGARAMAALQAIGGALGLDYAGIDFGLGPEGDLLLFEANATMVIVAPDADAMWDYRRPAITAVLEARQRLLWRRIEAGQSTFRGPGLLPANRLV